uniref:sodium- and chloride-dependent betaine transporter-like n=1 Tax=Styela clava TaxID=7725 RepID=UPI00193A9D95|nr:sodium- and chloride-dependent betaine transporter-like [Styela clava]
MLSMEEGNSNECLRKDKCENKQSQRFRMTWKRPLEFLLNIVGYTIGLGNIWRFSYLCYKNGGGAFLIPYFLVAALCGVPLFFQEIAMGQFSKRSCLNAWNIVPAVKGIGYAQLLLSWYYLSYLAVLMAWIVFYLVNSFTTEALPWSTCDNEWNTDMCQSRDTSENLSTSITIKNVTRNGTSPTNEFWTNHVLRRTDGIHDMGSFTNWRMMLCFLFSWFVSYLCVFKGIRTTGKVAYVTVIAPYIMLLILLVRGATLEGADSGVWYFITPQLDRLADASVWLDAGGQVLFTLGVCFAVLYGLGSYNEYHTDCYKHSIICVCICCGTSIFAGLVIFCFLGHMAHVQGKDISEVAENGPGLVFEVFPAGLSLLPLPQVWSIIFFTVLFLIAIDTSFGTIEGCVALCEDISPRWHDRLGSQLFRMVVCLIPFLLGIPMLFDGGIYVFELFNMYGNSGICILFVAFCEAAALAWIYGVERFFDDVKSMIGYYPNVYFRYCYKYFVPAITLLIFSVYCVTYSPVKIGDYTYPEWANAIGWILMLLVIGPIPLFFLMTLKKEHGTLAERWNRAIESRIKRQEIPVNSEEATQLKEEKV